MISAHQYSMVIRPKGRTAADEYVHKGRTYIEGRENSHYVIELVNHTHTRALAVVSVDGLSVTDGKPASFNSRGFVLNSKETVQIPGWSLDDQTAAEFVFAKRKDSYGNQTSSGGNEGVIGVAWFVEKPVLNNHAILNEAPVWRTHDLSQSTFSASASPRVKGVIGSVAQNSVQPSMGTAFGESLNFATTSTGFEKLSDQPSVIQLIYYDSAVNLQRMGIKLKTRNSNADGPQAFPGSTPEYCVPPPTWANKRW